MRAYIGGVGGKKAGKYSIDVLSGHRANYKLVSDGFHPIIHVSLPYRNKYRYIFGKCGDLCIIADASPTGCAVILYRVLLHWFIKVYMNVHNWICLKQLH